MGGAATSLMVQDPNRMTADVNLVIDVDQRQITADRLTNVLLTDYPSEFQGINQYGHTIPAYIYRRYNLRRPGTMFQLVELEVFDAQSWPQRPQYNLQTATRTTMTINGQVVNFFSPEWILREKILSQYQRQGTQKEPTDHWDIVNLIPRAALGSPDLDFSQSQQLETALENFVQKRPDLTQALKAKIRAPNVF
jgi:hypothetical protein